MMNLLNNFHFIRPWWLILIPFLTLLWWAWRKEVDPLRGWRRQVDPNILAALSLRDGTARFDRSIGVLVVWVVLLVAIAGPAWRPEPNPFAGASTPLMLLLKADESMEQAGSPPSAIDRAKLKIIDLAKLRKGEPLGLIAYAGSAHLVLPPTSDTEAVATMASEISAGIMPVSGDRLDLALAKANEVLTGTESVSVRSGGSVLVITDSVSDTESLLAAYNRLDRPFPVQFLAINEEDSDDRKSVDDAAKELRASVQPITIDDNDLISINRAATKFTSSGVTGESERWQEAGYFLVFPIALLVAYSFRREDRQIKETGR
ncbi:MAG: VWA domain-containing protein [Planctomycetota bacterium]